MAVRYKAVCVTTPSDNLERKLLPYMNKEKAQALIGEIRSVIEEWQIKTHYILQWRGCGEERKEITEKIDKIVKKYIGDPPLRIKVWKALIYAGVFYLGLNVNDGVALLGTGALSVIAPMVEERLGGDEYSNIGLRRREKKKVRKIVGDSVCVKMQMITV